MKVKVKVKSLSRVLLFATPWTVAYQAPQSMESPGKNTGMSCHFLLQGIFPTQGWKRGLLHCRQTLYHLSYQGSPVVVQTLVFDRYFLENKFSEPVTSKRMTDNIVISDKI